MIIFICWLTPLAYFYYYNFVFAALQYVYVDMYQSGQNVMSQIHRIRFIQLNRDIHEFGYICWLGMVREHNILYR